MQLFYFPSWPKKKEEINEWSCQIPSHFHDYYLLVRGGGISGISLGTRLHNSFITGIHDHKQSRRVTNTIIFCGLLKRVIRNCHFSANNLARIFFFFLACRQKLSHLHPFSLVFVLVGVLPPPFFLNMLTSLTAGTTKPLSLFSSSLLLRLSGPVCLSRE